ncbi:hypothetical protein ACFPRL_04660 [Pseudoclavibacter helvolus]
MRGVGDACAVDRERGGAAREARRWDRAGAPRVGVRDVAGVSGAHARPRGEPGDARAGEHARERRTEGEPRGSRGAGAASCRVLAGDARASAGGTVAAEGVAEGG